MGRERPTALLVDLDGVLRRWDPTVAASVEDKYGLLPGSIRDTALHWSRFRPAVTGEITHAEWLTRVLDALVEQAASPETARAAIEEWESYRGDVDPAVLELLRDVRAAGVPVGVAANATDALEADLSALGLADEVDVVVNSAAVGAHKPAREFFQRASDALGTPPNRVLFIDDSDRSVRGARAAGLAALRWNGPDDIPYVRAAIAD
jgi:putative hydrolase of the HAD superfamily